MKIYLVLDMNPSVYRGMFISAKSKRTAHKINADVNKGRVTGDCIMDLSHDHEWDQRHVNWLEGVAYCEWFDYMNDKSVEEDVAHTIPIPYLSRKQKIKSLL